MKHGKGRKIQKKAKPKRKAEKKVFIPVAIKPNHENRVWNSGHGPVKWSDISRPSNLRNPSLPPGFRENVSPPGMGNSPYSLTQVSKKKAEPGR